MAVNINIAFNGVPYPSVSRELEEWEDVREEPVTLFEWLEPVPELLGRTLQERAKGKGKATKGKKCSKGQVCGMSCISKTKICKQGLTAAQKPKANSAKKKTKAATGGGGSALGEGKGADVPDWQKEAVATAKDNEQQGVTVGVEKQLPTMNSVAYNPNAIPDLKPSQFAEYRVNVERLSIQDDPLSPHNQSFEQAKKDKAGYTKSKHEFTIKQSIKSGFVPSDEALAGVKLTKAELSRLEENRKEIDSQRKTVAQIKKAIDHPLVTEEERLLHKPSMSIDEAQSYAKDSFFGNMSMWHGNPTEVTTSMATEGIKPEKNVNGFYGQGTYFAVSREDSESYAYLSGDKPPRKDRTGLNESKVRVKNPYIATADELQLIGSHLPGDQGNNVDALALTEYMRAKGHDSIYVKDLGYFVAFAKEQSVVVSTETIERGTQRHKEIEGFIDKSFAKGLEGMRPVLQKYEGYNVLNKLNSTDKEIEAPVNSENYF